MMKRGVLIFSLLGLNLLLPTCSSPHDPTVQVLYEEPKGLNPFGHSSLRIGDKIYDVNLDPSAGVVLVGYRDWHDVKGLADGRAEQVADVHLTHDQIELLQGNIEAALGTHFNYNLLTNNCADWVEGQLRSVGVDIQDDATDLPLETLKQAQDLH